MVSVLEKLTIDEMANIMQSTMISIAEIHMAASEPSMEMKKRLSNIYVLELNICRITV